MPLITAGFLRALHATLRVRHVRRRLIDATPQYILTFWHAHVLLMIHAAFRRPISALVSQSRDGEMIASVFGHYKVTSVRGSSTRGGGPALRALIRSARQGMNLAFTPDGPKGPSRIVKEGVIVTAQLTGLPILPVAFAAKKKSSCAPGIGWSWRSRSPGPSSSTMRRSTSRATATSRSGERAWRGCSMTWRGMPSRTSMLSGPKDEGLHPSNA